MLIKESVLNFILGVSREIYPREFSCQLRGNEKIIEEAIILPKTIYGEGFATTFMDMQPIDHSIIGSAHSHPTTDYRPSNQDLRFFSSFGVVHLIIGHPHKSIRDVAAYNRMGERIPVELSP
ncbi:MAG: Mov34/MPN/PAD-1 family protein [Candidatus Altiarchaeota archaeon]|nr:Mov34/MPN/PAD-1 family protein [Candidatus Altiarchaeota archaeon]